MKFFLKRLSLFLLIFLMLNLLTYYLFTKPYLHNTYLPGDLNRVENSSVLFADSHGGVLDKKELREIGVYKFTASGDSYADIYAKLIYYHREHPELDTVLLTVDDHTLSLHKDRKNNNARSIYYMSFEDYRVLYKKGKASFVFDKYLKYYLPLLDVNNAGLIKLALSSKFSSTFGTKSSGGETWGNRVDKMAPSLKRKQDHFPGSEKSEHLTSSLALIVDYCREYGLTLVGLKFPLDGFYIDVLNGASYGADILFKDLGLPVIDLKDIYGQNPHYFKNQDHLNEEGASLFIQKLKQDLDSL